MWAARYTHSSLFFIFVHFLYFISTIYIEQFLISTHFPAFCKPKSTEDSETSSGLFLCFECFQVLCGFVKAPALAGPTWLCSLSSVVVWNRCSFPSLLLVSLCQHPACLEELSSHLLSGSRKTMSLCTMCDQALSEASRGFSSS